jgi:hypothetical protein
VATNDTPDWTSVIARPATPLLGSPWAVTTGGVSKNFTVTPDCHALAVIVPSNLSVSEVRVTGGTTGALWYDSTPASAVAPVVNLAQVVGALDPTLSVFVNASINTTVYVAEIDDPQVVSIVSQQSTSQVQIAGINSGVTVPTTLFASQAPVWAASNRQMALVDTGSLAANATAVLLAATGGRTYNLHGIWLTPLATTCNWHLQDTAGTDLGSYTLNQTGTPTNTITPPLPDLDLHGTPLTANLGLQLKNTSAGVIRWLGHVVYSY